MSIEDTLLSIDASLKTLVQFTHTFGTASAELGKPEVAAPAAKTTRTKKADPGVNDGRTLSVKLVEGDPEGTRYFNIPKHNTAARVLPGEVVPSIGGTVEIDGDEYTAKKAEYAKKSATAQAAQSGASAAASTTTAGASTASSSEASVTFKQVVDQLMVLSRDTREGMGRDGVMAFCKKHGVARVPELEKLGKNAELLAEVEALLSPDAEAPESDPFA